MTPRRWLLTCGLLLAITGAALAGAAAGGSAVYWAVRERLSAPAQPVAQAPQASAPDTSQSGQNTQVDVNTAVEAAVAKVGPAVVTVVNHLPPRQAVDSFGSPTGPAESPAASGSGVIISGDGYLLTNNHVVEGAQSLEVIFRDGQTVSARLIGTDRFADIAVLKVDAPVPGVAELGNSDVLNPGEAVIAIGSPLGDFKNTVTVGVVSATGRSLDTGSDYTMEDLIQTDAAINRGNSGGPLVNLAGQVIGINTLVVRGNGNSLDQAEGLGFAIASNTVKAVSDQLIAKGFVSRPYLGISWGLITPDVAQANGLPVEWGVYVREVGSDSPAAEAGLRPGDILTEIDGKPLDGAHPFINTLLGFSVGQEVQVKAMRNGQIVTLNVRLGERPHEG